MRDLDIRSVLLHKLQQMHAGENDTLILNELSVCEGSARVDVATVNGYLNAYEIKSKHDTLGRLPAQMDAYGKVFDFVTVVGAEVHLSAIRQVVPAWCGIMEARPKGSDVILVERRAARRNTRADKLAIAALLWREEALDLVAQHVGTKGMASKSRPVLWRVLADHLELEVLRDAVRSKLKSRERWRPDQQLARGAD